MSKVAFCTTRRAKLGFFELVGRTEKYSPFMTRTKHLVTICAVDCEIGKDRIRESIRKSWPFNSRALLQPFDLSFGFTLKCHDSVQLAWKRNGLRTFEGRTRLQLTDFCRNFEQREWRTKPRS